MKKLLGILAALAILGGLTLLWLRSREKDLSERPTPESSGAVLPPPAESIAIVNVKLSYAAMAEALNGIEELKSFQIKDAREKLKKTKKVSFTTKVMRDGPSLRYPLGRWEDKLVEHEQTLFDQDVDYTINVGRTSGFVFSPNGNGLRVSVPIGFSGQVGFTGTIAEVLSLDKKNFDGQVEAHLDISFDVDESWKPTLTINPSFDWKDKAQIEIVGGLWLPIEKYLNKPLNDALKKAADQIRTRISADDIKREVTKIWKAQAIALEQNGKTWGYCNVRPTGAFFSGTLIQPEHLVFNIGLSAFAQFSDKPNPPKPETLPLPPLQRAAAQVNQVRLLVPIEARFDTLKKEGIDALKGNQFEGATPIGNATVSVKDVEVFSQKDRIVIGLKFDAKFDESRFDEHGWIYLTAKPVLDTGKQEVSLDDIKFTRIINNELWKTLSILFNGTIRDTIKTKARRSLEGDIAELKASLQASLSSPETTPGVRISFEPTKVGLDSVILSDDGISVITALEGTVSIEVYSAALLKK